METPDLKYTKRRLAIIFAIIVFLVAFFLEASYFTIRYLNLGFSEKKQFDMMTNQLTQQFQKNPIIFNVFLTEWLRFRPPKQETRAPEWDLRFLNFIVLDSSGKVIAENLQKDIQIHYRDIQDFPYNLVKNIGEGVLWKKIDISYFWGWAQDMIFIKQISYSWEVYFWDVFFFFLITLCFSVVFYLIGSIFVDRNLKPVEETLSDMNDFIHNAHHELKTPISVIYSNLQMMKVTQKYEENLIDNSISEIKRMDALILELTDFSNIRSISDMQEVNISEEIQKIVQEYENIIAGKKLNIFLQIDKMGVRKINKNYFYIFFSNLLRNAIKYNHDWGDIKIIWDKHKLIISNTGEKISWEDIPFIFNRFFKGEKSRWSEWFGIWLSLVKKICDMYKWKITVASDKDKTCFEIKW